MSTENGVRHEVVSTDPNTREAEARESQEWLQPGLHRKAVFQQEILKLEPQPRTGKEREPEGWGCIHNSTPVQPGGTEGRAEKGSGATPTGLLTFHEGRVCTAGVAEVPHVQPLEAVIPQLTGVAQALKNGVHEALGEIIEQLVGVHRPGIFISMYSQLTALLGCGSNFKRWGQWEAFRYWGTARQRPVGPRWFCFAVPVPSALSQAQSNRASKQAIRSPTHCLY